MTVLMGPDGVKPLLTRTGNGMNTINHKHFLTNIFPVTTRFSFTYTMTIKYLNLTSQVVHPLNLSHFADNLPKSCLFCVIEMLTDFM